LSGGLTQFGFIEELNPDGDVWDKRSKREKESGALPF
jgi:hypothetical protein